MKQAGSLIAFLCVSWLIGSAALVHKLKGAQTGVVNASSSAAGQQAWSPEVHAYIRYLQDLEKGSLKLAQIGSPADHRNLDRIFDFESEKERERVELAKHLFPTLSNIALKAAEARVVPQHAGSGIGDSKQIPWHAGAGTVFFIVLSDSKYYHNKLEWIGESWGQDLPADQLMAIGDTLGAAASTGSMRVQSTHCPAHTHDGACCKMGEALINAQSVLKSRPQLKWAYIVDDDAYVRPAAMEERLSGMDPLGDENHGAIIGIKPCGNTKCMGFCGGAGAALSRQALQTLVGDSPSSFLTQHMQKCQRCAAPDTGLMWGDVSVGQRASESGINVNPTPGLYGWPLSKTAFDESLLGLDSKVPGLAEPLMYHYQRSKAQFMFLHRLFSPSGNDLKNGKDQILERQRLLKNGIPGTTPEEGCVTFKGNSQCWSQTAMEFDFGDTDFGGYMIEPPWRRQ